MTLTAGRILRSGNVKVDGQYRLEVGGTGACRSEQVRSAPADKPAQVRITEKGSDFAIIEVVCGCGEVIQIRCNYAGGRPTASQKQQAQEVQNAVS